MFLISLNVYTYTYKNIINGYKLLFTKIEFSRGWGWNEVSEEEERRRKKKRKRLITIIANTITTITITTINTMIMWLITITIISNSDRDYVEYVKWRNNERIKRIKNLVPANVLFPYIYVYM